MTDRIAGLVLAAGASTRMGPNHDRSKLLEDVAGRPLVVWPTAALEAAGVSPLVVVARDRDEAIRGALADHAVHFAPPPDPDSGMAGSIARGVEEVLRIAPRCAGILIVLGDLPHLRVDHVRPLLEAFDASRGSAPESDPLEAICVPVSQGRRGHPVLFGAAHHAALRALRGNAGARTLLERQARHVIEVAVPDSAIFDDIDTTEDLERARAPGAPPGSQPSLASRSRR